MEGLQTWLQTTDNSNKRSAAANGNDGQADRGPLPQMALTDTQMHPEAANGESGSSTPPSAPPPTQ